MLEKKRKFNKNAYDSFDSKNKIGILEIMTKKGYTLVGDIDTEHYKKYDVKFVKGDKELSFENETRINFTTIRDVYSTIHIPIRKQNTQCDFYIVWKLEMDEFFLISKEVIKEFNTKTVDIICNPDKEEYRYKEAFIDIPKNRAELFKKLDGKWKKINTNYGNRKKYTT